jgi:hypothetical protein
VDVGAIRRTLEVCREHRAGQPHVEQAWETLERCAAPRSDVG